jgi:hypothetical protein
MLGHSPVSDAKQPGGPHGKQRHDPDQAGIRSGYRRDRHHGAQRGAGVRRHPRRQGQFRRRPRGRRGGDAGHGGWRQRGAAQPGGARPGGPVHGRRWRDAVPRPRLRPADRAEHAPDRAGGQPRRPRGLRGQRPERHRVRSGAARRRQLHDGRARRHPRARRAPGTAGDRRLPRLQQAGRADPQRRDPSRARRGRPLRHRRRVQGGARQRKLPAAHPLLRRVARGPAERGGAAQGARPRAGAHAGADRGVLRRPGTGTAGPGLPALVAARRAGGAAIAAGQHANAGRRWAEAVKAGPRPPERW